jgi:hypothetical protein
VPAQGKAIVRGYKTPESEKVLPKIDKQISLRRFGYSVHEPTAKRQQILRKAFKIYGELKTLRHLNLERNYQADPFAKKVMGADVKFMSGLHAEHLKKQGRKPSSKSYKAKRSKK